MSNKAIALAASLAALMAAVPAQAVTAFAAFGPTATDANDPFYANIRWSNDGPTGTTGTSGTMSTITTNQLASPTGVRQVLFTYLIPQLASIGPVVADFTWTASSPQSATLSSGVYTQGNLGGSFSFLSTAPITIGPATFAAGTNLLSGTFGSAAIIGARNGNFADLDANTSLGQTLTFSSALIDFSGVSTSAFAIDLNNVRSVLSALGGNNPTTALRTFRTAATGEFGYEGQLAFPGIPEPQTWGLMVVGFGMVGLQVRRRSRRSATVSA